MTAPAAFARVRTFVLRVLPVLIGAAVVLLRSGPIELVPPAHCGGALEALIAAAAIAGPEVAAGTLFALFQIATVAGAVAVLVVLATRVSNQPAIAASTGLALGLSPLFPNTLAPPWEATAFLIAASAGLATWRVRARAVPTSYALAVGIGSLALTAVLFQPGWMFAAAAIGGLGMAAAWPRRTAAARWATGTACAATIFVAGGAWLLACPPDLLAADRSPAALATCMVPDGATLLTSWLPSQAGLFGPAVLALAVLGAFGALERGWRNVALVAAVGLIAVALTAVGVEVNVALAPAFVVLWTLTALGLRALVTVPGQGISSRVLVGVVLLLLPILQGSRRVNDLRDNQVRPAGHETVTLRQIHGMLNAVPQDAAFASEDASVDVMLRASSMSGRRKRKPFVVIPRARDEIRSVLGTRPVYAFALGQAQLRDRGFVFQPVDAFWRRRDGTTFHYAGLAAIAAVRPCHAVEDSWIDVSDALTGGRIALVADSPTARGPIHLFLGGPNAARPVPDGWAPRVLRGFRRRVFVQPANRPQPRVLAWANSLGVTADSPVLNDPAVVILRLHRVPNAPLALPVSLQTLFPHGLARRDPAATPGALQVCDASASTPPTFRVR